MIPALVITLREGMEAALVLGIILAYLRRTGRPSLNRYVYWGLGLAVLVSLGLGVALQMVGLDPENEALEGTLYGVGGIFVATMVMWMWRSARNLRGRMETRVEKLAEGKSSHSSAIGLLAFTFFMVAREGVETVLFLAAATLGQASIVDLVGGLLGIALAVLFAVLFVRGSLGMDLGRFFKVTGVVLLVLAARLLAGSAHEFGEVGMIPMSRVVMQVLGFFVRDRAADLLLMGLVTVPIIMVLWGVRRRQAVPDGPNESSAERRKRLAAARWQTSWRSGLIAATAAIVLAMASQVVAGSPFVDPVPQALTGPINGEINLPTADWEKGVLHKFSYQAKGSAVRLLAAKLEDGSVATALDACQICGSDGYMQAKDGGVVICKVCNAPIPMNSIGQGGGCNPLPLASRTEGAVLVLRISDLESRAPVFAGPGDR